MHLWPKIFVITLAEQDNLVALAPLNYHAFSLAPQYRRAADTLANTAEPVRVEDDGAPRGWPAEGLRAPDMVETRHTWHQRLEALGGGGLRARLSGRPPESIGSGPECAAAIQVPRPARVVLGPAPGSSSSSSSCYPIMRPAGFRSFV